MKTTCIFVACFLTIASTVPGVAQTIETIAGGGLPAEIPLNERFHNFGIVSPGGDYYFLYNGQYHRLDPVTEQVTLVPFSLTNVRALDLDDNFYSFENNQIIKTDGKTGERTVIAGTGDPGTSPDGTLATEAQMGVVRDILVIKDFIYFTEGDNVRFITLGSGKIQTLFESGVSRTCAGKTIFNYSIFPSIAYDPVNDKIYFYDDSFIYFSNETNPACFNEINTRSSFLSSLAVDSYGNLVYTDYEDFIEAARINMETGEFTKGLGEWIEGLDLSHCSINEFKDGPGSVKADFSGNLFFAYVRGNKMVYVSNDKGKLFDQKFDISGNGGQALDAVLDGYGNMTIDDHDNIYITDDESVRKISPDGKIEKFIGKSTDDQVVYNTCAADVVDLAFNPATNSLFLSYYDNTIFGISAITAFDLDKPGDIPEIGLERYDSFQAEIAALSDGQVFAVDYWGLYRVENMELIPVDDPVLEDYVFFNLTAGENGEIFLLGRNDWKSGFFRYNIDLGVLEVLWANALIYSSEADRSAVTQSTLDAIPLAYGNDDILYFSIDHQVFSLDFASSKIARIAGFELPGFSGDGGPAINASLSYIQDLAVDSKGNLYISDSGNDRIRKISGLREASRLPEIGKFVLVNPRTDQEIRELEALDYWFLPDLWRINVIAEPVDPALVQSVTYRVDGKYDHTENAYPYALGGDDAGDYREWSAGNGVYNICATPYSLPHRQGTEGEEKCITLSLIFTLPAMMEGSGEIYSARGSYVTMPDAEGATFYDFTAYYDHATEEFSGWASVEFPDAGLMFTSSTPHHFFQRTTRAHLFWDGMLNGEEGYRMDQYLGYRPTRTDTRIIIRHISTGEIIYDSEVTIAADETNQLSAPLWTELNGSGDAVLEASIDAVHVGPNPFSDRIALALPMNDTGNAARVTLTDLQGRVIYDGTAMPGAVSQIETSGLNSGLYILYVKDGEMEKRLRLVKTVE